MERWGCYFYIVEGAGAHAYPSQNVYKLTEPNIFTFLADQSIKGHLSPNSKCVCPSPSSSFCLVFTHVAMRLYMSYIQVHTTSSAAQGGGGSFKNRKPIGEVGCCESRMAERIH